MNVLDLRWRPVVLATVIGGIAALSVAAAWGDVARPIGVGVSAFRPDEIEGAYLQVGLLCLIGFGTALGMFVWAQGKAARITIDRGAKQAVVARGFPLAWSTKTYDLDGLAFRIDSRRGQRRTLYFIYVSAGGGQYMVERAGTSIDHAHARMAQLSQLTGIPS